MSEHPSIGVVINNHNNGALLSECIESVLSQTDPPDEIVIVDDGSSDDSREIIQRFAARHPTAKAFFKEQSGQIGAVGRGLHEARSEILLMLDGDDRYLPDHVRSMRSRWREHPEADLLYCRFEMFGETETVASIRRLFHGEDFMVLLGPLDAEKVYDWGLLAALSSLEPGHYLGNVTSTLSIRSAHAKRLAFAMFADWRNPVRGAGADKFLLLSSALAGGRRVYVPDRTVGYRIHEAGVWSSSMLQGDPKSIYRSVLGRLLVEQWLVDKLALPRRRAMSLLELETSTAPDPSPGHLALYRKAHRKALRRDKPGMERWRLRLQKKLRDTLVFFGKKGAVTFSSHDPAAVWP